MKRVLPIFLLAVTTFANTAAAGETWAERLGYPTGKRVLILHANRVGVAYEVNRPSEELLKKGILQSAAVMTPCPWFDEFALWCRANPGYDIGVNLTLNSHFNAYRWGPVASREEVPSLVDEDGYLWRSELQFALMADAQEVQHEVNRQIARARSAGIRPTHLTPHLGALLTRPDLTEIYLSTSKRNWIPAVMVEMTPENIAKFRDEGFPLSEEVIELVLRHPLPKLDDLRFPPDAETYEATREGFFEMIKELSPGLTQIVFTPTDETPALKLLSERWQNRVWEAQLLNDPETHAFLDREGVIVTNWGEVMRRFEGLGEKAEQPKGAAER